MNYELVIAHTFSCKLRVVIKHSVFNLKSLLTVLCVNMSKISSSCEDSGEYRGRTDDLLHAMQALQPTELIPHNNFVVPGRLELPTSTLSVWRSNQLSYRTGFKLRRFLRSASSFSIIINISSKEALGFRTKPLLLNCQFSIIHCQLSIEIASSFSAC